MTIAEQPGDPGDHLPTDQKTPYQHHLKRVDITVHNYMGRYIIPNNGILKSNLSVFPRNKEYFSQYYP